MTATLQGSYRHADQTPMKGTVYIKPSVPVVLDVTGRIVMAGTVRADLVNGVFSVALAASDDLTLNPAGVTYTVSLRGLDPVVGVFIPNGGTVDMADVTSVDPAAPVYAQQVTRAEFDALVASGVGGGVGGGSGGGLAPDPAHPGFYLIGA